MKKKLNFIVILLYLGIMLTFVTACGKQEFPQEPAEAITDEANERIDFLQTAWKNSAQEPQKSDSWSVINYTEGFLPQITEGELGTRLYAVDNNFFWTFSEIWKKGEEGYKSREYLLTSYDMNTETYETFSYTLLWNEAITGFDDLIQGMEQLTHHIVEMDCVNGIFSFLVEYSDKESKHPMFYVLQAQQDGQVLSVLDITAALFDNDFYCPNNGMPGAFHRDKKGNMFIGDFEMLSVCVLNADGAFSEIITPQTRTNLCFKGKLPDGEPVYDYSNADGTRTVVTYDRTSQKCLYNGEIYWPGGIGFSNYGQAFFVDGKGLKCWNVAEGNIEIVCDRIETATYDYVWMNDKEELYLITTKNPFIVKLQNKPPQDMVELELCITTMSRYVEECANAYSMRHPYVRIKITEVSKFDDNAMNKLFADLSEGNGPDILVLDRSDLISFYNAGALSDLSTVLSNDTKEQIFPGVLDYGTIDGALVGITCEATIDTLFVSKVVWKEERWALQDVLELISNREKAGNPIERVITSNYTYTPFQMLSDLALKDIANSGFVDPAAGTCSFDSEEFIMLLEYCKKYGQEATGDDYRETDEQLAALNSGKSLAYVYSGNFVQFSKVKAMLGEDYYCVGYPAESTSGSFFEFYDGCVAVSSQSTASEEANDFLRYLVDYSTQKKYAMNWVRKDVLLDSVKDAVEVYGSEDPVPVFFVSESSIIQLEGKEDGSSYVKEYIELSENCIPQKDEYEQINSIITEEVAAFFSGQKTAEQVAAIIQSRVTLFLEE